MKDEEKKPVLPESMDVTIWFTVGDQYGPHHNGVEAHCYDTTKSQSFQYITLGSSTVSVPVPKISLEEAELRSLLGIQQQQEAEFAEAEAKHRDKMGKISGRIKQLQQLVHMPDDS